MSPMDMSSDVVTEMMAEPDIAELIDDQVGALLLA